MPAKSEKQRRLMAIAEHHPEKVYKKNRGVLKMSKKQLSDYASTKHHSAPNGSFFDERAKRFGL
jgi:uncharacterized protein YjiK